MLTYLFGESSERNLLTLESAKCAGGGVIRHTVAVRSFEPCNDANDC